MLEGPPELCPYLLSAGRADDSAGVDALDTEGHGGHGEVDEVDNRYQQHQYRDGEQGHGGGAVALGHVVSFHVAGVVGVMQVAQTGIHLIFVFGTIQLDT